jgi:hypothetical protein
MSFKSEPIQVPFQGDNISIMKVYWTPRYLAVSIRSCSTGKEAKVRFSAEFAPNKLRLVDEADLNDWTNIETSRS